MPRGRFAPSPTGDLHLGGARTALLAWLAARRDGSSLVLRMEDIDTPRVVPGAAGRLLEDLRWLGLDWDEGPDVGGPDAPYTQSERSRFYLDALERLAAGRHLFPCYCSRAEVARAATAPHGPGDDGPRYPGTCRHLTEAQRAAHEKAGRRPALRLRVEPGDIALTDQLAGPVHQDVAAALGDFILRRADGLFAYQLAVVVDDLAMNIAEIVRGDDLLGSTPRQLLLRALLAPDAPPLRFAHLPLILGPDGKRLSKRHGAISVRAFRAAGWTAERLVGRLAASLGLCPPDTALRPAELLAGFSYDKLDRTPTVWTVLPPGG
ncbi:MAG TPA: tRNA glutamyl-Q(34) synthetase GluQRS [Polyangia bacterium]|jgi:glutamyl-tRNA synthetase|nr:tRNA glutamyl-Q(34) synthetase GluQRS [Polyangia bacterium]